MKKPLITLGLFFTYISIFLGQSPYYINYDTNDGLPSSEVYQVHCTNDGKIWCSTDRGVAVHNGYEFTSYSTNHGLNNNTNFKLLEDSKNRIWFTGLNKSISVYENGKFSPAPFNDRLKEKLVGGIYAAPIEDAQGRLLFFNLSYKYSESKFARVSEDLSAIEVFTAEQLADEYQIIKGTEIEFIVIGQRAIVWGEKYSFRFLLIRNKKGWIGWNGSNLIKINKQGEIVDSIDLESPIEMGFIDSHGDLWAASHKGIYHFSEADFSNFKYYLPNSLISHITEDFEGSIWVSTHEGGVYYFPNHNMNTVELPAGVHAEVGILSAQAMQDHIFFGTSRDHVLVVDKSKKARIVCGSGIKGKQIRSGHRTGNNIHFWAYTITEKENGDILWSKNKLAGNITLELKDGYFLAGYNGKYVVHGKGKTIYSDELDPPFHGRIECMAEDNQGNVWIGTQSGLLKINAGDYDAYEHLNHEASFLQDRITDIKIDEYENIWISTLGQGLAYKTPDTTFQLTTADGLQSDLILCLLVQDEITTWVGTNQGLNRLTYSWEEGQFKIVNVEQFGIYDGLPSNYINALEYWEENIWIATNKGVSYILPEKLKRKYPKIQIRLDEVMVNEEHRMVKDKIILNPSENNLRLTLLGISYLKNNQESFYKYRLIGADAAPNWTYTNDRNIQFADLQAGEYVFEAAAKNRIGEWSDDLLRLEIEKKPYFIQTNWFKLLMLLLTLFLFAIIFLFRERQLAKSNKLEKDLLKANMQAKEHELSALRNQMNPHFVFNSLNAIQSFIFKNKGERANYYLSIFSRLMRDSLRFSRLKYISLEEEIEFLKSYLELEQMRFPGKFEYFIDISKNIPIKHCAIPALLFQPILENAIKHAFKDIDYKGRLIINIEELAASDLIRVSIEDNGCGFSSSYLQKKAMDKNHQSFGLAIVKNRIDLINAGKKKKQQIAFEMINLKDLKNGRSGVKVIFNIPVTSLLDSVK